MKCLTASVAIFILSLFSYQTFAQARLTQSIDSLIHSKTPRIFNGVVIITQNGKTVYERSHGFKTLDKKVALSPDDQFLIGSVSKQITAVLLLQEVQAGRVSLNQTIRYYLPGFKKNWADSVSIQQLLNHTSGITDWDKQLSFRPGTRFSYSNINYNILGKIIEKTSGQTYAVLTAKLFKYCEMNNSTVPGRRSNISKLVNGYAEDETGNFQKQNTLKLLDLPQMGVPASGIISTAKDLTSWMHYLHHNKLLQNSIYQMMTDSTVVRPHRWGALKYGDGIQLSYLNGNQELSMSGYVPGFISTILYYPATKISIVILENISPVPTDMNRVYYDHDQIRNLAKSYLK